jgi:hypothetical protein
VVIRPASGAWPPTEEIRVEGPAAIVVATYQAGLRAKQLHWPIIDDVATEDPLGSGATDGISADGPAPKLFDAVISKDLREANIGVVAISVADGAFIAAAGPPLIAQEIVVMDRVELGLRVSWAGN